MHNTIAYYPPTDAQPVPAAPKANSTPILLLSTTLYGVKYFLGRFGLAFLVVFPHSCLCTPSLLIPKGVSPVSIT